MCCRPNVEFGQSQAGSTGDEVWHVWWRMLSKDDVIVVCHSLLQFVVVCGTPELCRRVFDRGEFLMSGARGRRPGLGGCLGGAVETRGRPCIRFQVSHKNDLHDMQVK